jgi:hypothetical protein
MFVRRLCAILRAPEGDGGSGGGGGSGGDDGNAPLFTEQQFTAIGEIVNKALTSKIPKMVSGGLEAGLKGVNWKDILTPLVADLVPKADSGSGGGSGDDAGKSKSKGGGTVEPEVQRQLAKLAEDLEKERKARLEAVQESETIKRSHEFGTARQRLYEGLKPHASETLHDVWVDHLLHHKRLKVEEGVPLLEVEYAPVRGMPKQKEFLPLDEAIPHLIAADEAKRFQAPPGTNDDGKGTPGPRARRGAAPSLDSKDPMARVAARLESLGMNFDNEFST